MANQIALQKAVEQIGVDKIITFHRSVRSAISFTSGDGEGVRNQLPGFQAYHVNGTMRAAERDGIMREFREEARALISNARCLTEGVDIPAVDMVAFLAPRRSRVDIVQAIGRAMRTAPGKTTGYIFLPLFVQETAGELVEQAVARSDFEEIWNVLQALQEQDEVLADVIREMREAEGHTGGFDDSRFREKVQVLGPAVSLEALRGAITTRCIERLSASWDYFFGKLVAFTTRFDHCNVPRMWPEDPQLSIWVDNQRHTRSRLSLDRIKRLDELGFSWDPHGALWEEMFARLEQYKARFGHCNVPRKWPDDPQLARWIDNQRHRHSRPSADRVQRLTALGFVWDADAAVWEEMFARLVQYKARVGDCNVPDKLPEDMQLANWVHNQRAFAKRGRLSADRVERLTALGFVWDARTALWEEMFARLVQYKARFAHCNVRCGWPEDPKLGFWVGNQRMVNRRGRLPADRVERLTALGFEWKPLVAVRQ